MASTLGRWDEGKSGTGTIIGIRETWEGISPG